MPAFRLFPALAVALLCACRGAGEIPSNGAAGDGLRARFAQAGVLGALFALLLLARVNGERRSPWKPAAPRGRRGGKPG